MRLNRFRRKLGWDRKRSRLRLDSLSGACSLIASHNKQPVRKQLRSSEIKSNGQKQGQDSGNHRLSFSSSGGVTVGEDTCVNNEDKWQGGAREQEPVMAGQLPGRTIQGDRERAPQPASNNSGSQRCYNEQSPAHRDFFVTKASVFSREIRTQGYHSVINDHTIITDRRSEGA